MKATNNILSTIGNTPLVEVARAMGESHFRLFAKLEGFNPGGSIKDRPALCMIQTGIDLGLIHPGTVIVESSSGNLGIGLAQVCRYLGTSGLVAAPFGDCSKLSSRFSMLSSRLRIRSSFS